MGPKREQIAAACVGCQKAKAKCDGARPTCRRCARRGDECFYDVEPGTTRALAQKRKRIELQNGVDELLELYEYLRTRPDPEVVEIIRRIRVTEDPFAVVRLVRDGDLLLQRRLSSPQLDPVVRRLDADALLHAHVKVPARPWTSVAGDGIVSHLISNYFSREQQFVMPFIDQTAFLKDMAAADPSTADFCSPMLVNAVCAMGAFASSYAEAIDAATGRKLREQFFNEAKQLFDKEAGKSSLATTEALFFLYMYSTSSARDRAGLVFRLAGCEMFQRLKLGFKVPSALQRQNDLAKDAVSRAAWGMFYCETLVASAYLQVSLVPPPTIPRYFVAHSHASQAKGDELLGSDNILDAQATGADIFYRIASYRPAEADEMGGASDLKERERLYSLISGWHDALPPRAAYVPSQYRQWYYLRCHYHFVAILLYRPLQDMDKAVSDIHESAAEICAMHCARMVRELEDCKHVCPSDFSHGSIEVMNFSYICLFTLITMLETNARCWPPFIQCLRFFHDISHHWPAAEAMLHGVNALSKQINLTLPPEAKTYLTEGTRQEQTPQDLPISWVIPQHDDLLELLSDSGANTNEVGVELGTIISKWNSMSINF